MKKKKKKKRDKLPTCLELKLEDYKDVKRGETTYYWNCDNCPLVKLVERLLKEEKWVRPEQ